MIHIKLSKRKHVPLLFANDSPLALPIWQYKRVKRISDTGLSLDKAGESALFGDFDYAPPKSLALSGKTVLDLGACCGETAYLFMRDFGVTRLICVECDLARLDLLRKNLHVLSKFGSVTIISEPFSIDHLKLNYDFIKCNVEGYEMLLLDYMDTGHSLKPCVVHVHTNWIRDRFLEHGFKIRRAVNIDIAGVCTYVMINWDESEANLGNVLSRNR